MKVDDLRANPLFMAAWPTVWPLLERYLTQRTLEAARGAKCQIETAQAETARQREVALLIAELGLVASPAGDTQPRPLMMKKLHSMSEESTET